MSEPSPPRRPRGRSSAPLDPGPARALGVAGVFGLMVVMVIMIGLILSGGGDGSDEGDFAPSVAATATPTKTPKPRRTPEPLSAEEQAERQEAIDLVQSRAFEVVRKQDWDPEADLNVLIGETTDGGKLAFFFVAGDYLGNDGTDTSAKLSVVESEGLETTLRYGTTSGPVEVIFRYDGATLAPESVLPDASTRAVGVVD